MTGTVKAECPTCEVALWWTGPDGAAPAAHRCPKCGGALDRVRRRVVPWPVMFLCLWHHPLTYRMTWLLRRKRRKTPCSIHDPCSSRSW